MLIDVYVLAGERSRIFVDRFISGFIREFVPAAEEYEFPQYSENPVAVYKSFTELIQILLKESEQPHSVYWTNPNEGSVRSGMLFFTLDGGMIVGLTIAGADQDMLSSIITQLAEAMDGQFGYCTFEEPPPDTSAGFVAAAQEASPPKLLHGLLVQT